MMQSRKLLLDQFSSFLQLADDRFKSWISEPRLRRNMQQRLEQSPDGGHSERFWSMYWHRCWVARSNPWAEQHLLAYLQEPCYWVAQEVAGKVAGLRSQVSTSYGWVDFFQMAMAEVPLVLTRFQAEKSNHFKAFAQVLLSNRLKSKLRQQRQADFCSVWGLLRKTSRKQLRLVLQAQGVGTATMEQYRLLWMGFQALYVPAGPDSGKLPAPDGKLWQGIAEFYNEQRLTFLSPSAPTLDEAEVEQQLRSLSSWIRNYHYPKLDSLNRKCFGDEESGISGEWQDAIADQSQEATLLQALMNQEEQERRDQLQDQLHQRLTQAFGQLDSQSQQILRLLYRERLSQQEVMEQVQVSQPTISRRLKKAKAEMIKALLDWAWSGALPGASLGASPEGPPGNTSPASLATEVPVDAETRGGSGRKVAEVASEVNNFPKPDELKAITVALEAWLQVYLQEADWGD